MITPEDREDISFLLGEVADLSCKEAAADLAIRILMGLPDEVTVEAVIKRSGHQTWPRTWTTGSSTRSATTSTRGMPGVSDRMTPEEQDARLAPHIDAIRAAGDDATIDAILELLSRLSPDAIKEVLELLDRYRDMPD